MKRTRNLTCKNKKSYNSRQDAMDAMQSFYRREFGGLLTPNVSVYPCNGHFHWGHSRPRKH